MEKEINLKDSVYQLVKAYPDLKNLLADLGFKDILLLGMLETAGRIMTLEKGAAMKKIGLETVIAKLKEMGYKIV